MLLHHVSVGVTDVARAALFYDSVLAPLGYKRVMEVLPYGIGYGEKGPEFWIQLPANQAMPSAGNGVHFAFNAPSERAVNAFHTAALAIGGSDEGSPGPRPEYSPNYYGAFVRDPDGNKIEAVFFAMQVAARPTRTKTRKTKPARKARTKPPATVKKPTRKPAGRKAPGRGTGRRARAKKR